MNSILPRQTRALTTRRSSARQALPWLAALALFASGACTAQSAASDSHAQISLDVGIGHESQTSPLFQISPESTILYIGGLQRLRGSHVRTSLQGATDWSLGDGLSVSLAGDVTVKRSPQTPDLDFMSLSVQPALHQLVGDSSIGVGLNLQRIDVAGAHFRDSHGLQLSWTRPDGKNLWSLLADYGVNRHKGDLDTLDGSSASIVLQRQIAEALPGIDSIDLTAILGRERNTRGFRELSDRNALLSAQVQWSGLGATWTVGRSWRRARFDETVFPTEPPRQDRTSMLDLAAEWPLTGSISLRIEVNDVRNESTTRLYENHYQQIAAALRTSL